MAEKKTISILHDYIPNSKWRIDDEDKRSMFFNPVTDEMWRIPLPPREVMEKRWEEL